MARQPGFFDAEERPRAVVDFEAFRAELEAALPQAGHSRGAHPPWEAVLLVRVLVLQALHTLSDNQAEYPLRDRLSVMRCVGLALQDAVPDAIPEECAHIAVHRPPWWESRRRWQMPPPAAGANEVEQVIKQVSGVRRARPSAGLGGRNQRLEQRKLIIRQGLAGTKVPNQRAIS